MSVKTLHLQVSDTENIHPAAREHKKGEGAKEVKNCLQVETGSAQYIILGKFPQGKKIVYSLKVVEEAQNKYFPIDFFRYPVD